MQEQKTTSLELDNGVKEMNPSLFGIVSEKKGYSVEDRYNKVIENTKNKTLESFKLQYFYLNLLKSDRFKKNFSIVAKDFSKDNKENLEDRYYEYERRTYYSRDSYHIGDSLAKVIWNNIRDGYFDIFEEYANSV